MTTQRLQDSLAEVERLLASTGELLLRGDAPALERETAALRHSMVLLAQASRGAPRSAALQQRMSEVSLRLGRQRDALARRSALAERTLAAVLPQTGGPTYAAPVAGSGFKSSVARIYAGAAP